MKFSELSLTDQLFQNVVKLGYEDLTPIQVQALPVIMQGQDIAGLSQTGTGKTAAFLLPLIQKVLTSPDWKPLNSILVLVPTRELAEQTEQNFKKFTEGMALKSVLLYGGVGYDKQKELLAQNPEFIIATPGRLIDLYKENFVDLKQVQAVVFDEADRLFDMGFKDDMKFVLQRVPPHRQLIMFSATLNLEVMSVAYQFGSQPVEINISRDQAKAENVTDKIFHVGRDEKPQHLLSILKSYAPKQVIIFTNYKNSVQSLTNFLVKNGYPAVGISSLLSQSQRLNVITKFKAENLTNYLVATDVAARGLDIQGVDLVINYDLPMDPETYVHRIGRTGRAGREGIALSLISDRDIESLPKIEDLTKKKIEVTYLEDSSLVTDFIPFENLDRPMFKQSRGPKDVSPWASRSKRPDNRPPRGDQRRGPRPRHSDGSEQAPKVHGQINQRTEGAPQMNGGNGVNRPPLVNRNRPQHNNSNSGGPRGPNLRKNNSRDFQAKSGPRPARQNQPRPAGPHQPRQQPVVAKKSVAARVKSFFGKLFAK
ncbi:MAG: DEAD/DEAH box helicase [Pseudobdellovibrionaceae bacterium]